MQQAARTPGVTCPKCQFQEEPGRSSCRRCGIIFAKYDPERELTPHHLRRVSRDPATYPSKPAPMRGRSSRIPERTQLPTNWGALIFLAMIVGGIGLFMHLDKPYQVVGAEPEEARKVVILMHGFGAPGDDLVPAATSMAETANDISFVVLEAPHHRGFGRAWMVGGTLESVEKQVDESRAQVLTTVDDLVESGVAPENIFLGGFSQGAQMALDVGFAAETEHQFGGLLLIAGGWPNWPGTVNQRDLGPGNLAPNARVLVAHGRSDGVIHFRTGESVADRVGKTVHSEFVPFDGGHRISDEAKAAVVRFL